MARRPNIRRVRRIGRVSVDLHHDAWLAYFRDGGAPVRRRLAADYDTAERIAAQINAQLTAAAPTAS